MPSLHHHSLAAMRRLGRMRYSAVELLLAITLLIFVTPFMQELRHGEGIEALLMTLVFVSAVFVIGASRRTCWTAVAMVIPAVAARWLEHCIPSYCPPWLAPSLGMCFVIFVVFHLVRSNFKAREVDVQVLCAALSVYFFLGLLWSLAYVLVGRMDPHAFNFATGPEANHAMKRFNSIYFSFVTLSTVGYGDITPVSKVARMLAVTEAMTGMIYMAVSIARLVALYSTTPQKNTSDPS